MRLEILGLCLICAGCAWSQELNPPAVPETPAPPVPAPSATASDMPFKVTTPAPDTNELESKCCLFYKDTAALPVGGTVRYEVWRRQPLLENYFHSNAYSASAYVYYFVDDGDFAQCGWDDEEARAVIMGLDSTLTWDPKWRLALATKIRDLKAQNKCLLTDANIDVTDAMMRVAQRTIQKLADNFDDLVKAKSNVQQRAAQMWADLQQPLKVGDGQWVLLQPQTVTGGPIVYDTGQFTSQFSVTTEPVFVASDQAPPATTKPLPDITVSPDPQGIHVTADVGVGFLQINDSLQNPVTGILGRKFDYDRRELEITNARLYGSGPSVSLAATVRGIAIPGQRPKIVDVVTFFVNMYRRVQYAYEKRTYKLGGTLYLTARPSYSASDHSLVFSDLKFDAATTQTIEGHKSARWILQTPIIQATEGVTHYSLAGKMDALRLGILSKLNGAIGQISKLHGSVNSLAVQSVFVEAQQIKARVAIDGAAQVEVAWSEH